MAIMLLFNFMLVLPIIGTADKIFAKLVTYFVLIILVLDQQCILRDIVFRIRRGSP
jgi:hypothetical protein